MNMDKKKYVAPMQEINGIDMGCDILTMSAESSLSGTVTGSDGEGTGKDADANERVEWGNLW